MNAPSGCFGNSESKGRPFTAKTRRVQNKDEGEDVALFREKTKS
jgi:hypothetical protein